MYHSQQLHLSWPIQFFKSNENKAAYLNETSRGPWPNSAASDLFMKNICNVTIPYV